jgi:hypothetical protein
VKSTNFSVTNPSYSIYNLYVAPVASGGDGGDDVTPPDDDDDTPPDDDDDDDTDDSNINGKVDLKSNGEGGADIEIVEIDEGLTISLVDFSEGMMEVEISSETPVGRIVVLGLEEDLFGDADPTEIVILMDGEELSFSDLATLLEGTGSEPVYYLSHSNGSYELFVYIPETTAHLITAKVKEDEPGPNYGWVWILLGILLIVVIVILLAVSLLTAAQRKRKMEAYFEDFEVGMKEDDRVVKGDLEEKEWDDIIE